MKTPQIVIAVVAALALLGGGFAAGMTFDKSQATNTGTAGAAGPPAPRRRGGAPRGPGGGGGGRGPRPGPPGEPGAPPRGDRVRSLARRRGAAPGLRAP